MILTHTILYHNISYYIILIRLHQIISYYIISYYIILYYIYYVILYYIIIYIYHILGDVYQAQQKSSGCPGSLTCACVARCKGRINKVLVGTTLIKNGANKKWS